METVQSISIVVQKTFHTPKGARYEIDISGLQTRVLLTQGSTNHRFKLSKAELSGPEPILITTTGQTISVKDEDVQELSAFLAVAATRQKATKVAMGIAGGAAALLAITILSVIISNSSSVKPPEAPSPVAAEQALALSEPEVLALFRENGLDFEPASAVSYSDNGRNCNDRTINEYALTVCSNTSGVAAFTLKSSTPFKPSQKAILAFVKVVEAETMASPITVIGIDNSVDGPRAKTAQEREADRLTDADIRHVSSKISAFISNRHPELPSVEGGSTWMGVGIVRARVLSNDKWYSMTSDVDY